MDKLAACQPTMSTIQLCHVIPLDAAAAAGDDVLDAIHECEYEVGRVQPALRYCGQQHQDPEWRAAAAAAHQASEDLMDHVYASAAKALAAAAPSVSDRSSMTDPFAHPSTVDQSEAAAAAAATAHPSKINNKDDLGYQSAEVSLDQSGRQLAADRIQSLSQLHSSLNDETYNDMQCLQVRTQIVKDLIHVISIGR